MQLKSWIPSHHNQGKKSIEQVECVLFAHSSRIPEFHIRQSGKQIDN